MQRYISIGLVWLGRTITVLALLLGVCTAVAMVSAMLANGRGLPLEALTLNLIPIVIVSAVPAWIGRLMTRAGATRGQPHRTPLGDNFD